MFKIGWISLLTISCSTQAYWSYLLNNATFSWVIAVGTVLLSIPNTILWVYVAKVSNNLVIDALIYDSIIILTYLFIFSFLGQTSGFFIYHWLGVIMVISGLILLHL